MHDLNSIQRFRSVSDRIATSGQPLAEQFPAIQAAGFQVVVNLALPSSEGALPNEAAIVESLGIKYIPIPVIWENPTIEQFQQFLEVMNEHTNVPVFVHCAKNMRVSVFIYLYQRLSSRTEAETAKARLYEIWHPNQVWSQFIQTVLERHGLTPL